MSLKESILSVDPKESIESILISLAFCIGLLTIVSWAISPVSAHGNWTRDNASLADPITTLDEAPYDALMDAMQPAGNSTNVTSTADIVPDIPGILHISLDVFKDN